MHTRHSLFWKLAALVISFCLAMIGVSHAIGEHINRQTSYLSEHARDALRDYAREAQRALEAGEPALGAWLAAFQQRENVWATVIDENLQPVSSLALPARERRRLSRARPLDAGMSRRALPQPLVSAPVGHQGHQLILHVPERFMPWKHHALLTLVNLYLFPVLLSLLFCVLLYSLLMTPLRQLRQQSIALRDDPMATLLSPALAQRRDEIGELARSLDYLTQRLRHSVTHQRQLLRDLSHELRTPLSRLRVACETPLSSEDLRQRLEREVNDMQRLVDAVLELAWLDSEHPEFPCAAVDVQALWDVLCEDACFESGWSRARLPAQVPDDCRVLANLNTLAHAMENILRNAIRHSPPLGMVRLSAQRSGEHWQLCIADQGPGVPEAELDTIFQPFTRLNASRPGGEGYGLGLTIAQRLIHLQGGSLHARNGNPGLQQVIRLQSV